MSERKAGGRRRPANTEQTQTPDTVEETPQEAAQAEDGRFMTTLGEQGAVLPIGTLAGGQLHKDIVVKRWTTKEERAMGDKMAPDANMAEHVSVVVANMCSKLGHHDLDEMKDDEKSLAVSMMYMADVFYTYLFLRRAAMGNKLRMEVTCPRGGCGVQFPYTGHLDTIEVAAVNDADSILWTYKLEDPIEIRKKTVTHFQMAYPKWTVMDQSKGSTNQADVKAMTIQGTIVGLNDEQTPVALTLSEIDELSKIDFEGLQEGINDHFLGPKMGVEGKCEKSVCTKYKRGGYPFVFPINWRYQDFFGASSR